MSISTIHGFSVTYEIYTVESIMEGCSDDSGFMCQDASLRDALCSLGEPDQGYEASDSVLPDARWVTAYLVNHNYHNGETENRCLHFPPNITGPSKLRIMRLLGVYGIDRYRRFYNV